MLSVLRAAALRRRTFFARTMRLSRRKLFTPQTASVLPAVRRPAIFLSPLPDSLRCYQIRCPTAWVVFKSVARQPVLFSNPLPDSLCCCQIRYPTACSRRNGRGANAPPQSVSFDCPHHFICLLFAPVLCPAIYLSPILVCLICLLPIYSAALNDLRRMCRLQKLNKAKPIF